MKITVIAAMARNRVIGDNNTIPWMGKFPQDMKHFRNLTEGPQKAVLMGRKTWESIGAKPLRNRANIVLTRDEAYPLDSSVMRVKSAAEAIRWATHYGIDNLYIIGGAQVYTETLPIADSVVLTVIEREFHGDAKMPVIDQSKFKVWAVESGVNEHFSYQIQYWNRGRHLEAVSCLPELN